MTIKQPFFPHYGAGQNVAAAAASASTVVGSGGKQLRIQNKGASEAYVRTFSSLSAVTQASAGVATAADLNIQPGQTTTISRIGHDSIAYISAAGTTLNIIPGEGF